MSDAPKQELSAVAPAEALDLESLRVACPSWRVGGSSGNWHAFRSGISMMDGPWSLLRCHLHADTLLGLAERLCLQEYLDGLSEQELAEVWQRVELPESSRQAAS
jgi:hypothetical protein